MTAFLLRILGRLVVAVGASLELVWLLHIQGWWPF